MKFFFIFLLTFSLLLGIVYSQEAPKYNFASMQADKALTLSPGEVGITKLYFFNIAGNRNTHISLSIGEAPDNWDIGFEPALHESTVSIGGVQTTFTENLYVEPSEAVDKVPEDAPEDIEYISTGVGYVGAKPVEIKIKVPVGEELGTVGKIRIDALASWAGQTGAAAITQARSFDYTVTVSTKEFIEEIVQPAVVDALPEVSEEEIVSELPAGAAEPAGEALPLPAESVGQEAEEVTKEAGGNALIITFLIIIIALLALLVIVLVKKKR